ncbi:TerD family protein [Thiorhodococcus mannitoliphagus]|uniref:TerD family protein n=1 Tax=Thiorhodococcus mannitoliphagus TaxID=329406 RepID=A0A6P1DR44_9GAMM|nr:TerD family protein [Thiorhodococcus mannitoliphagus]NEX19146.1 TerD family protein [Thiorhodococcus mannitoliphagus]
MAANLVKGGNISLSKTAPSLKRILVGLGWEARATAGSDFDLDASAFLLGENGKVRRDEDFIFYNQLTSLCGSVEHSGDNLTGEGEGDDEALKIDLEQVPEAIKRILVCVTIHEAEARSQNFGQVSDAFMRIANLDDDHEIARFDLSEDYSTETAMIFGEVYRRGDEWKFKAVGQGFAGGLEALCHQFGVDVA